MGLLRNVGGEIRRGKEVLLRNVGGEIRRGKELATPPQDGVVHNGTSLARPPPNASFEYASSSLSSFPSCVGALYRPP